MLDNPTLYLNIFILLILIIIFNKLVRSKLIERKEGFIGALSGIGKVFSALIDFFTNFPTLIGIMVDALISFCINFIDIFISLFAAVEWIIELPGWAVQGAFYLIAVFLDIIVIAVTWLNPVNMIKGIVKLILAVIKIVLSLIMDTVIHLLRLIVSYIGNTIKGGLWGIPHGPEQHAKHRWTDDTPIDDDDLGYGEHHHNTHGKRKSEPDAPGHFLYKPLRCYKEIGTNGFMNIIGTIICPPLGIFMAFGLKGWFKILICSGLTLLYYFPGLFYAFLITAPLGIGNDIEFEDCGGRLGGFIVKGCEARKTKEHCHSTYLPNKLDTNGNKIKACEWNDSLKKCRDLMFDDNAYESLIIDKNKEHPDRTNYDPSSGDDTDHTFAYKGDSSKAKMGQVVADIKSGSYANSENVDEEGKALAEKQAEKEDKEIKQSAVDAF